MSQRILEVGRVWLGSDKEEAVKGGVKHRFNPLKPNLRQLKINLKKSV